MPNDGTPIKLPNDRLGNVHDPRWAPPWEPDPGKGDQVPELPPRNGPEQKVPFKITK